MAISWKGLAHAGQAHKLVALDRLGRNFRVAYRHRRRGLDRFRLSLADCSPRLTYRVGCGSPVDIPTNWGFRVVWSWIT